jgi:hypothetical protein
VLEVNGTDRKSGETLGRVDVPKYLFRGEAKRYPTTTATMSRVATDESLTPRARALIPGLSNYIETQLRDFLSMSEMDSAGFAQHYGLPTSLIDLTSNTEVAGFFASEEQPGSKGFIGIFPTRNLVDSAALIDLRNHDRATRPRRQEAFVLFHRKHEDLKTVSCVSELQSLWFGFTLTETDKSKYQRRTDLVDASRDAVAGALQLIIDSMVIDHGKLPDELAYWLSRRIAPAPFVAKPVRFGDANGKPLLVELVSALDAGLPFSESREREKSYRFWSSQFNLEGREPG